MDPEHRDAEMDARLQNWAADRTVASILDNDPKNFQQIIQARIQERKHARFRQGAILAAAVVLAFFTIPQWNTQTAEQFTNSVTENPTSTAVNEPNLNATPSPQPIQAPSPSEPLEFNVLLAEGSFTQNDQTNQLATEARLVLGLGKDIIGLDANSAIQLDSHFEHHTLIHLESGTIAANVDSRGSDGLFQIVSGDVIVEVVGTQFGVHRTTAVERLRVWVSEGTVRVKRNGRSWNLSAGQELIMEPDAPGSVKETENAHQTLTALLRLEPTDAASLEPSAPVSFKEAVDAIPTHDQISSSALPSLQSLRLALSQGDTENVITSLQERLQRYPNDANTWSLLAHAAQRSSNPSLRLQALRKVIELDQGAIAQNARYAVAQILSQDPNERSAARNMWKQFLDSPTGPGPLEDDAWLELAKLEILANNDEAARTILLDMTQKSVGTAAAREASELLEKLNTE